MRMAMNKLTVRKQFRCWITGGHKYEDGNLEVHPFPKVGVTCFSNVCVKCGKSYVFEVSNEALYCGTPLDGYEEEENAAD